MPWTLLMVRHLEIYVWWNIVHFSILRLSYARQVIKFVQLQSDARGNEMIHYYLYLSHCSIIFMGILPFLCVTLLFNTHNNHSSSLSNFVPRLLCKPTQQWNSSLRCQRRKGSLIYMNSSIQQQALGQRRSVRFEYPLSILFAVTHDLLHHDLQHEGE